MPKSSFPHTAITLFMRNVIPYGLFLILALLGATSCKSPSQVENKASFFCDSLETEFETVEINLGKGLWRLVTRGGNLDSLNSVRRQWFDRLSSSQALTRIDLLKKSTSDSLQLRRLTVSRRQILRSLLINDPEISRIVDSLRVFALTDVSKSAASFSELDSSGIPLLYRRRDIYRYLNGSTRDLSSAIVRLARLRNQRAQALGYNSLLDLNLHLSDVSRDELNQTLALIDSMTVGQYKALLSRISDTLSRRNLEEGDVFFYEQKIMNSFLRHRTRSRTLNFALETITDLGIKIRFASVFIDSTSQLKGRPWLVTPHAPDDIRILYLSSSASSAANDISDLLSKLGQSVQLLTNGASNYMLRKPSDPLWESATGQLFTDLLNRRNLQRKYLRIPAENYDNFARAYADSELLKLRRLLTLISFEIALYDNPNRDMSEVYEQVVGNVLLVKPDSKYQLWSSQADLLLEPATQYCRLYGSLISAQIYSAALREHGTLAGNPQFGAYLQKTYFEPASRVDWPRMLLEGTGEKLDPNYFLEQYLR